MLTLSLIIVCGFSLLARSRTLREYKIKAMSQLEYQSGLIQNHFQSVRSDILFLPRLNEMIRYRDVNNDVDRRYIEQEFLEFTRSKMVYDQIRFLDRSGMEQVRINFNNGSPSIVEEEDLQDKSDRYYFRDSIKQAEGDVYISPFDLNKEYGKIELPYNPMIRFGTPLFDSQGEIAGVIILYYLGDTMLEDLRTANRNYPGSFFLLNMNGYWLFSDKREDEWGFMFPDRQNLTLSERDPVVWEKVSGSTKTQFVQDDVLVSSLILTPFPDICCHTQERSWILMNTIILDEMGISGHFMDSQFELYSPYHCLSLCCFLPPSRKNNHT